MKKTVFLFLSIAFLSACNNTTNEVEEKTEVAIEEVAPEYQYYGDTITDDGATSATELLAMMDNKDSIAVKVKGTVNSSCKVKGCWMKMDLGKEKEMHVKFKDYGFFVPKNLDGQTAIMEGYAKVDTIDVDHLRHLAQDAGKSEEEIAAINEPEVTLTYVANGVILK